jgi:hypothetical protein
MISEYAVNGFLEGDEAVSNMQFANAFTDETSQEDLTNRRNSQVSLVMANESHCAPVRLCRD